MTASIVILTGERGVGKSTVCRKAVAMAQARGYTCGGVLTLSWPNGTRDVLDVESGRSHRLTLERDQPSAVAQGRFRFDPEALAWGNDVLTHVRACHLLVVDELGPLELEREEGWSKAFDVLRGGGFALALVVVRPELVESAQLKLQADTATVITVTFHNRNDLPSRLLEMLEGRSAGARHPS